jgi:3-methyladenine DNA glycosylase AlkC
LGFKRNYKKDLSVFEFLQKWAMVEDKNTKWIIKEGMKKLAKEEQKKLEGLKNFELKTNFRSSTGGNKHEIQSK